MLKLNHPFEPHIADIIEDESSISVIKEYPDERFRSGDELMVALQGGTIHLPKKEGFLCQLKL